MKMPKMGLSPTGLFAGMANKISRFQEPHEPNRSGSRQLRRTRGPFAVRHTRAIA